MAISGAAYLRGSAAPDSFGAMCVTLRILSVCQVKVPVSRSGLYAIVPADSRGPCPVSRCDLAEIADSGSDSHVY